MDKQTRSIEYSTKFLLFIKIDNKRKLLTLPFSWDGGLILLAFLDAIASPDLGYEQGLVKGAKLCLNPYFFGWL